MSPVTPMPLADWVGPERRFSGRQLSLTDDLPDVDRLAACEAQGLDPADFPSVDGQKVPF